MRMAINKPIIEITIKNVIKHNVDSSYLVVASLASLGLCWSAIKVKVCLLKWWSQRIKIRQCHLWYKSIIEYKT